MVFFNVAFDTDNNIDFSFWRLTSLSWKSIEFSEIQTSRFKKITKKHAHLTAYFVMLPNYFLFSKVWNEIMNPKYVLNTRNSIAVNICAKCSKRDKVFFHLTWFFFVRQFSTIKAFIAFFRHLSLILSLSVQFSSRAENHITAFTQCAFDDLRVCMCVW